MSKIKKSIEGIIEMPKSIIIGDPMYFEQFPERTDLIYNKNFEGKDNWLGYIRLNEEEEEFKIGDEICKSITYVYNVILAPNKEKLELYKRGRKYSSQKQEDKEIGVDSASYYIQIGERYDVIRTGGDGYWGNVLEFYNNDELDGIIIDMAFSDLFDFEENKRELEYLFNFKF